MSPLLDSVFFKYGAQNSGKTLDILYWFIIKATTEEQANETDRCTGEGGIGGDTELSHLLLMHHPPNASVCSPAWKLLNLLFKSFYAESSALISSEVKCGAKISYLC